MGAETAFPTDVTDLFGMFGMFGKSGRLMMDALAGGERSSAVLAELTCGGLHGKGEALTLAMRSGFTEHHAFMLGQLLQMACPLDTRINDISVRIEPPTGHCPGKVAAQRANADTRPGLLPLVDRIGIIPGVGKDNP